MITKDFTLPNGVVVNKWDVDNFGGSLKKKTVFFQVNGYILGNSIPVISKNVIIKDGKADWSELAAFNMTMDQLIALFEGVLATKDLTKQGLPDFTVA